MGSLTNRIGGALGAFARRLALQALVSSIVMSGIGIASRDDFALPRGVLAGLGLAAANREAAAVVPSRAVAKEARLPFSPVRLAAAPRAVAAVGAVPSPVARDVVLFPQCRPECESHDPLLVAAKRPSTTSPPPALQALTPAGPAGASSGPGDELPPPAGLTMPAARASLVDAAAALPGRALGAAVGLVGWGG